MSDLCPWDEKEPQSPPGHVYPLRLSADLVDLSGRRLGKDVAELRSLLLVGATALEALRIFLCFPEADDVALACLGVCQHVASFEAPHLPELRRHRVLVGSGRFLHMAGLKLDRYHSCVHASPSFVSRVTCTEYSPRGRHASHILCTSLASRGKDQNQTSLNDLQTNALASRPLAYLAILAQLKTNPCTPDEE